MYTTYNSVPLQTESVQQFVQEAVYSPDGKDYLYTHLLYVARHIWNPAATGIGNTPAATMDADGIRNRLMTPRKVLKIAVPKDGQGVLQPEDIVVQIPMAKTRDPVTGRALTFYPCDPNYGPTPLFCNIVGMIGDSFIVDWGVEAWFKECDDMHAILSNRWSMTEDIDQDYWTTRIYEGVAIFRADYLEGAFAFRFPADVYRRTVAAPLQSGYKRTATWNVSPDGLQLKYVLVDRQQPQSINPKYRRITRIEGYYQESNTEADINVQGLTNQVASTIYQTALAASINPLAALNPFSDAASITALVAGSFLAINSAITYPEGRVEAVITVYGSEFATRNDLVRALGRAAAGLQFGTNGVFDVAAIAGSVVAALPALIPAAIRNRIRDNIIAIGALPAMLFESAALKMDLWNRTATLAISSKVSPFRMAFMAQAAIVGGGAPGRRVGRIGLRQLAAVSELIDNVPGLRDLSDPLTTASRPNARTDTTPIPFADGTRGDGIGPFLEPQKMTTPCQFPPLNNPGRINLGPDVVPPLVPGFGVDGRELPGVVLPILGFLDTV